MNLKKILIDNDKKEITIIWNNKFETKSICNNDNDFDIVLGFCLAYCKRKFGSYEKINKFINKNIERG